MIHGPEPEGTYFMTENGQQSTEDPKGELLVYRSEEGQIKLEVRLENETVWLSQKLMAELFQKDVRTINEHIKNIYSEGELEPEATIRKFWIFRRKVAGKWPGRSIFTTWI